jgi:hypothetical protein
MREFTGHITRYSRLIHDVTISMWTAMNGIGIEMGDNELMAKSAHRAYREGRCPCCCSYIDEWPAPDGSVVQPQAVAEGVVFCGRCIGNKHHISHPEVLVNILKWIVTGTDRE